YRRTLAPHERHDCSGRGGVTRAFTVSPVALSFATGRLRFSVFSATLGAHGRRKRPSRLAPGRVYAAGGAATGGRTIGEFRTGRTPHASSHRPLGGRETARRFGARSGAGPSAAHRRRAYRQFRLAQR